MAIHLPFGLWHRHLVYILRLQCNTPCLLDHGVGLKNGFGVSGRWIQEYSKVALIDFLKWG